MRGTERTAPANGRRARRILSRALVVLGGSIAGTAAAWAISSGGAAAAELPDTRPAADHQATGHAAGSGAGQLLSTGDRLTERLDEPAAALPGPADVSTAVRPATGAVHEVDTAVRTAVPQTDAPDTDASDADASGAGLRDTVRGAGDDLSAGLDTAGKKVRNDLGDPLGPIADPIADPITKPLKPVTEPLNPVTDPLAPVTEPVPGIGNPPPADLPSPADPSPARGAVLQHDAGADHRAEAAPRAVPQAPADDADRGTRHLPAGGLPFDPAGPNYERPVLPLDLPAGSGSTGHDNASFTSQGPVAGEQSDVPLLPDPALVRALIPDEDRLNIKLAEQPGTTPD